MAEHVFDTHDDQTPHLHDDAQPTESAREPRQLDPNKPRRGGQRKRNPRPPEMSIEVSQPHDFAGNSVAVLVTDKQRQTLW